MDDDLYFDDDDFFDLNFDIENYFDYNDYKFDYERLDSFISNIYESLPYNDDMQNFLFILDAINNSDISNEYTLFEKVSHIICIMGCDYKSMFKRLPIHIKRLLIIEANERYWSKRRNTLF